MYSSLLTLVIFQPLAINLVHISFHFLQLCFSISSCAIEISVQSVQIQLSANLFTLVYNQSIILASVLLGCQFVIISVSAKLEFLTAQISINLSIVCLIVQFRKLVQNSRSINLLSLTSVFSKESFFLKHFVLLISVQCSAFSLSIVLSA